MHLFLVSVSPFFVCVSHTYSLGVNGMHSKEQRRDKSKSTVLEHSFVTSVHEHKSH